MLGSYCVPTMKDSRLSLRMSSRRLNKLRLYAADRDKTVTQIVEDWIDRLPVKQVGDFRGIEPHQSPAIHPDPALAGQGGDSAQSG